MENSRRMLLRWLVATYENIVHVETHLTRADIDFEVDETLVVELFLSKFIPTERSFYSIYKIKSLLF